jgi:DNA invertase Pin-like site-specific DNA recombinase
MGGPWRPKKLATGAERVFSEKQLGAKADRAALAKALAALGPDGVLLVTRLDRLGHGTRNLLDVLAGVAERGAGFRCCLPNALTRPPDLLGDRDRPSTLRPAVFSFSRAIAWRMLP